MARLSPHRPVFPYENARRAGLGRERPDQQRHLARICEARLEKHQVVGVQRQPFSRVAAEETNHRQATGRAPLLDGALNPSHVGIRQPVQRAAAVVALHQFVIFYRDRRRIFRRDAPQQQSADLRSARMQRAETLHRFVFQPVDQRKWKSHR